MGGKQAQVLFSGLAPNYVGLYQLNVLVRADAPVGTHLVEINANGISSTVDLPIQ
jgi:minor extracellular serine protease Vpr